MIGLSNQKRSSLNSEEGKGSGSRAHELLQLGCIGSTHGLFTGMFVVSGVAMGGQLGCP